LVIGSSAKSSMMRQVDGRQSDHLSVAGVVADGPEDAHVAVRFEEAQAHELRQHAFVEADLGRLVPLLEPHRGVEAGLVRAVVRGGVVAPL
jgi:hypothetical protein